MSTFTIDSDNNITALAELPAGADQSQSFSTAKELAKLTAEWPASRLVETWNSFAGVAPFDDLKPVKKFTNRKAAVARIWQAVGRLAPNVAPPAGRRCVDQGESEEVPGQGSGARPGQKGRNRIERQQEGGSHCDDEAGEGRDPWPRSCKRRVGRSIRCEALSVSSAARAGRRSSPRRIRPGSAAIGSRSSAAPPGSTPLPVLSGGVACVGSPSFRNIPDAKCAGNMSDDRIHDRHRAQGHQYPRGLRRCAKCLHRPVTCRGSRNGLGDGANDGVRGAASHPQAYPRSYAWSGRTQLQAALALGRDHVLNLPLESGEEGRVGNVFLAWPSSHGLATREQDHLSDVTVP